METQVSEIAMVNDVFRTQNPGHFNLTRGVIDSCDVSAVNKLVREFDQFTEDNDPHGEHDFGKFEWQDFTLFWKIDYYNRSMAGWCDPLSKECQRVLTVMLACEY